MTHSYHFDVSHFSVECYYDTKEEQRMAAVDSSFCIGLRGDHIQSSHTKWALPAAVGKDGNRLPEGKWDERVMTAELVEEPQLLSTEDRVPVTRFVTRYSWSAAFNVLSARRQIRVTNGSGADDSDPFADGANATPILGNHHGRTLSAASGVLTPLVDPSHRRQLSMDNSEQLLTPRTTEALQQSLRQVSLGRQSIVVGESSPGQPIERIPRNCSMQVLVMEQRGFTTAQAAGSAVVGDDGAIAHTSPTSINLSDRLNYVYGGQWYETNVYPATPKSPRPREEGIAIAVIDEDDSSSAGALEIGPSYAVTGDTNLPSMRLRFLVNASILDAGVDVGAQSPARRRLEISRFKTYAPFPFVYVVDQVSLSNARADAYNVAFKLQKSLDAFTISTRHDHVFITKPLDSKQRSQDDKARVELHSAFAAYVNELPPGGRDHFLATVPFHNPAMRGGGSGSGKGHILQLHEMFARSDADEDGVVHPLHFSDPASRVVIAGIQGTADVVAVGDLFSNGASQQEFAETPLDERPSPSDPLEHADEIREQVIARAAAVGTKVAGGRDPVAEVLLRQLVKVNLRAEVGDSLNRVLPKRSRQARLDVVLGNPFQPNYYEFNNFSAVAKEACIDLVPFTSLDALPPSGVQISFTIGNAKKTSVKGQTFEAGGEVVSLRLRRFVLPDVAAKLVHRVGPIEQGTESSVDVCRRVLGANTALTLEGLFDYEHPK